MPDNRRDSRTNGAGEVTARLQDLIGRPDVSEAYVRFRLDLLAAQRSARQALAASAAGRTGGGTGGQWPLRPRDVPFPAEVLGGLFQAIRTASATHGQDTGDLRRLNDASSADPTLLSTIAAAAAFGPDVEALDAIARRADVYPDAVLFVGRALAAPCVAEAVRERGGHPGAGGGRAAPHRCAACGSVPGVARLRRADGHRLVTCGLCGTEWETTRLSCAWCGTEDHAVLGVLRLDEADARWVETCDGCRGYVKTVDERRLPDTEPVFPVVEESATLHLDLLAEREGYIRRLPYVLSE